MEECWQIAVCNIRILYLETNGHYMYIDCRHVYTISNLLLYQYNVYTLTSISFMMIWMEEQWWTEREITIKSDSLHHIWSWPLLSIRDTLPFGHPSEYNVVFLCSSHILCWFFTIHSNFKCIKKHRKLISNNISHDRTLLLWKNKSNTEKKGLITKQWNACISDEK